MKVHGSSTLFLTSIFVFWLCLELVVEGQAVTVQITGNVYPPAGMRSLPPGTEVSLDNHWGYCRSQLVTSGRFEFAGVPVGRYTLRVRANGFRSSEQLIEVESRSGSWFHLEIRLGSSLARDDSPPAGVSTVPLGALRVSKEARREFDKGRSDYKKGKFESALRRFRTASSICPDWASPHAAGGFVHIEMKQAAEAEEAFRRAIALNPEWYVPWKQLGCLFLMTNRSEEALENLDRARGIYPADALTHTYRGEALYRLGRQAEAAEAFKEALELNQEDLHAGYRLGYVLIELGQRVEALTAFETLLRKHPDADLDEVRQMVSKLRTAKETLSQRD